MDRVAAEPRAFILDWLAPDTDELPPSTAGDNSNQLLSPP